MRSEQRKTKPHSTFLDALLNTVKLKNEKMNYDSQCVVRVVENSTALQMLSIILYAEFLVCFCNSY